MNPGTRDWFTKRGVWMLLREKGEVLVWRSLIRRVCVDILLVYAP